ncbi:hypothetical protein CPAR01_09633 [Colletotrichum paranaense]|uniref:Uncharacterized protein n=1 Tax=Colletotrichum paranaense TaxID=1914294 RepID=A0ABQ9SHC1_9PEZI|nr:hypothetical protein CPAR01_09633 [Colletotrichum paranaense]
MRTQVRAGRASRRPSLNGTGAD